jgi:opacity protein-like surface antigen
MHVIELAEAMGRRGTTHADSSVRLPGVERLVSPRSLEVPCVNSWGFLLGDTFDTGWNGAIGVTFNISETVGIQAEYMYHRMNGPDRSFTNLGRILDRR